MPTQRHTVKEETTLQDFVGTVLAGARPRRVQQLIRFKSVAVNGEVVTRALHTLKAGDVVVIHFGHSAPQKTPLPGGMKLLFEDEHLIVVDKPPGLLTIATDKERTRTAYALLTSHVREQTHDEEARVFIVHRLDQGTSGLLVFARTEEIKRTLQDQWKTVEKKYQAVVEGCPKPESDTIRSVLKENRALRVYSTDDEEGDEAITRYRTVQKAGRYCLLEITIETGRKNQIRVHLAERGHPVVGDAKYGAHGNPIERLALHAWQLAFTHPVRQERLVFTSPIPPRMRSLVASRADASRESPPAEGGSARPGKKGPRTFRATAQNEAPSAQDEAPSAQGEAPSAQGDSARPGTKGRKTFRNVAPGETPSAEGVRSRGGPKKRTTRQAGSVEAPLESRRPHGKAPRASDAPRQGRDHGKTKTLRGSRAAEEPGGGDRTDLRTGEEPGGGDRADSTSPR